MKTVEKHPSRSFSSWYVVLVILLCGFLAAVSAQRLDPATPADEAALSDNLQRFGGVLSLVEQNYAEPVDANKAVFDGAIPGMLRALDPHSTFFDPKAYAEQKARTAGNTDGRAA